MFAANGSAIKTYGEQLLNLNLGLRRTFKWKFIIADVAKPILEAHFLKQFALLVDFKNKRLVDGITKMSTPAKSTMLSSGNIPTIADKSNSFSRLLCNYPQICRMSPVPVNKMHTVVDHITTSGPPVKQKVRRLAPDKLKIARAEFQYMVEQGICRPSSSP